MMAKKENKLPVSVQKKDNGITEIHVEGSILPNYVYLEILSHIKELGINSRKIFVVRTPVMMRLIRECIPSEYHEGIVLIAEYEGEEQRRYAS